MSVSLALSRHERAAKCQTACCDLPHSGEFAPSFADSGLDVGNGHHSDHVEGCITPCSSLGRRNDDAFEKRLVPELL